MSVSAKADSLAERIDTAIVLTTTPFKIQYDSTPLQLKQPSATAEQAIFSDPKLHYQQKTEEQPDMLDAFFEWFTKKLFGKSSFENRLLARKIVYWSIAIIALICMILLLRRSQLTGLIKPKSKSSTFSFNDITEELDTINFADRIRAAEQEHDFRNATRWKYLQVLYQLDKKGLIVFANYKTNINYLHELKTAALRDGFTDLSKLYDYVWYGEFKLTEKAYTEQAERFSNFQKDIHA